MMSDFIEVEWFGREDKIGIVLTYNQFDGFKARMAPIPGVSEELDAQFLMEHAAKIPFAWAWGVFAARMKGEWIRRHLGEDWLTVRYDRVDYDVETLQPVPEVEN